MKLYHLLNLFNYKRSRIMNAISTKWEICGNGVIHGTYRSIGVPLIERGNVSDTIKWGENLCMNNGLSANQIGFNSPCIFKTNNGSIIIGDNVGMSQCTMIAVHSKIIIGKHTTIGGGVKIYSSDFHSINYLHRRDSDIDSQSRKCKDITIGDDCFIGAGSIILKGVSIGARTVIGAGSVVTKSIPEDELWAGNPAVFIRKL